MSDDLDEDLSEFERAVLLKLVAGDHPALKVLQAQSEAVRVTEREWHGTAGFITSLKVDEAAPWFGSYIGVDLSDVAAKIAGMRSPTIYVVFVRAGRLDALEGTAFQDEPWPDPIVDFELSYISEPRDVELPVAHYGESELPAAWQELADAKPADWYVARPSQRRDGRWTMHVIDTTTRDPRRRRGREWKAVGRTEVECVREMARRLREISNGSMPR